MTFADVEDAINTIKSTICSKFPSLQNIFHEGLPLAKINEFEKQNDLKLPEDVVNYLQLVNGENAVCEFDHDEEDKHCELSVFFGLRMLDIDGIKREYDIMKELSGNEEYVFQAPTYPEGSIRPTQNSRYWVALAHDGCGNSLGVDLKPGPNGKVGQVILWGKDFMESRIVISDSWAGFLKQFAKDLANDDLCEVHPEHPQGLFVKKYGLYNDYLFKTKLQEYTA